MQNFVERRLKPATRVRYGLPGIPYPIPAIDPGAVMLDREDRVPAALRHSRPQHGWAGQATWQQLETAIDQRAPEDARDRCAAAGEQRWLEIGPVNIGGKDAADPGEAHWSPWEKNPGISGGRFDVPARRKPLDLVAWPDARVLAAVGVYATFSGPNPEKRAADAGAQEAFPRPTPPEQRSKPQQTRTPEERFLGCLLGGAVGDALGAPVEFMDRSEILRRFGPAGITQYAPAYGGIGTITDDTQMTLFTAEGLIRGWVRGCFKGITTYTGVTAHAYLRWLQTQGERPSCDIDFGTAQPGWLFQQRQLHDRRAPGITCLAALRAMRSLGEPAGNDSKGCGGVMRVAPVGLFAWRLGYPPEKAFRLGCDLAALTHGHPSGKLTAGVLAVLIQALTDGASLPEALAIAKPLLRAEPGFQETLHAIETAEALAGSDLPPEAAITRLGQGWVAEEALAISIYCALVARDFREAVILAVNHDGDSDSTGAITGNLLGTIHGVQAIPAEWLEPLELREVITELARDLYDFKDWVIGEDSDNEALNQKIWRKYPGF
jgi:ADP-ribosylglycohydrolase